MDVQKQLFALQDADYAAFSAKLIPTIEREKIIGVRTPQLRELAKKLQKQGATEDFLSALPHFYHEENVLHAILIGDIRDYAQSLSEVERFLPYVDNWAVCDTLRPRAFANKGQALLPVLQGWMASEHTYTCRFGIGMLMVHYLDAQFSPAILQSTAEVRSEEYYVNMMVAWFFATALSKQWEAAISYLEQRKLPLWTHRKTIQKAIESYRITQAQKVYLKTLK